MTNSTNGYQIASLIREINSKLNHSIKNEFKDTGLTVPQIMVLKTLSNGNRLKISEISKEMNLVNSTVSGIIDRLEKQDIVKRIRSEEDRRIVYIELSEKGNEIIKNHRAIINNFFNDTFGNLGNEEINTILTGLQTVKNVLDKKLIYEDKSSSNELVFFEHK
ncbi:DNA-binding transcriptional regulator, MarR family [Dethiosulfatibacter aminovorans DSM 17477]|uniref:DNA-binding transcriptional regulator, MarR family n=1 Tax=Dethiosulfatibacter aminovorans DSM 17477 TaxID=1121476 RepID=A0A1M6JQ05_9FIRM|nr:MarR family transcriptional regulator [Dethiosulfatibacter aminovorans]SHJ48781.1 DNA-binding transcriptional regulator, MarR family [Dethiosulfatibacter aminovorans DSM 17477]